MILFWQGAWTGRHLPHNGLVWEQVAGYLTNYKLWIWNHSQYVWLQNLLSMVAMLIICKLPIYVHCSSFSLTFCLYKEQCLSFFHFPEYILACLHTCCTGIIKHKACNGGSYMHFSEEMCGLYWWRKTRYVLKAPKAPDINDQTHDAVVKS